MNTAVNSLNSLNSLNTVNNNFIKKQEIIQEIKKLEPIQKVYLQRQTMMNTRINVLKNLSITKQKDITKRDHIQYVTQANTTPNNIHNVVEDTKSTINQKIIYSNKMIRHLLKPK